MGKIYLWAAILVLTYNDGRIDFDVRRDLVTPARVMQFKALNRFYDVTGYRKIFRALNPDG